jgi:hypothetical protein
MLLDVTYQAACGAVFYSCFCRFVRMDSRTRLAIRASFWLLSLASIVCMVAPALGWGHPTWLMVVLLAGIAATQAATSHYWRDGTPRRFLEPAEGDEP